MSSRARVRTCITWLLVIVTGVATPLLPAPSVAQAAVLPAPPQVYLNTTYTPPSGQTITVPAGGDFQAALNAANSGDVITLQAGATYTGPFTLPPKAGTGWIIVRTSTPDSALPPPGNRIDPSYAPLMPKLVVGGSGGSAIQTASGAHHFRFIGIEMRPTSGAYVWAMVTLDNGTHDFIFDRCYIHGDPSAGSRQGIEMNSTSTAVIDSYFTDFKSPDDTTESYAIHGWNGWGPYKIVNNYLAAASQNLFFGGQDPSVSNLVSADIEIRGNHFAKPLSWRVGDPTYVGVHWGVKNLFELKNARRVLVDGNIFEYNWPQPGGQDGFAILFTPRNQSGGCPWCTVEDITFTHNIVRHTTNGIVIFGTDNNFPSQQTHRILIQNNLFYDVGAYSTMPHTYYTPGGFLLAMTLGGAVDITVDHNTMFQTNTPVANDTNPGSPTNFTFTNTLTPNGPNGVPSIPGAVVTANVLLGGNPVNYPAGNFFPSGSTPVVNAYYGGSDFGLVAGSPYQNASTDGTAIGANIGTLNTLTVNVISGARTTAVTPPPSPTPPPPSLALTVQNPNFGSVAVGGSKDLSLAVTNTGGRTPGGSASAGGRGSTSAPSGRWTCCWMASPAGASACCTACPAGVVSRVATIVTPARPPAPT